jgi:hypothetical protein
MMCIETDMAIAGDVIYDGEDVTMIINCNNKSANQYISTINAIINDTKEPVIVSY